MRPHGALTLWLKNIAFALAVPGVVAVCVPLLIGRDRPIASGVMLAGAVTLLALGAAVCAWCVWDFAAFGRGTPAPIDAPKKLVTRGLYRLVRNPMYEGVLAVLVGWAFLFQSGSLAVYALIAGLCFHLFVILYEEPHLLRVFGAQYDDYCARVGRWLPRFRR